MSTRSKSRTECIEFARFTDEEQLIVLAIVNRAVAVYRAAGIRRMPKLIEMDISAVHVHTPLRLADLLAADDFNFEHDIFGIYHHLDRRTGELGDFFLPRFAKPSVKP